MSDNKNTDTLHGEILEPRKAYRFATVAIPKVIMPDGGAAYPSLSELRINFGVAEGIASFDQFLEVGRMEQALHEMSMKDITPQPKAKY